MKITDGKDTFEVVEKIPTGYVVWNIGDNMIDGYLPLTELEGDYIIPETLKAIKIDDANELKLLRNACHYGVHDLKSCKRKMNRKNPKGYIAKKGKALAEATIKSFERLTEGL